jgi:hypothetical protein
LRPQKHEPLFLEALVLAGLRFARFCGGLCWRSRFARLGVNDKKALKILMFCMIVRYRPRLLLSVWQLCRTIGAIDLKHQLAFS